MELLQDAIASQNIFVWGGVLLFLLFFLKILQSAAKIFLMLLIVAVACILLGKLFPDLVTPALDYVRESWFEDPLPGTTK